MDFGQKTHMQMFWRISLYANASPSSPPPTESNLLWTPHLGSGGWKKTASTTQFFPVIIMNEKGGVGAEE